MNYKVSITSQAEEDLRGIFAHIAYELQSPINAAKQLQHLEQEIMSLSQSLCVIGLIVSSHGTPKVCAL